MKTIQQVEPRVPIESLPVVIAAPGSYYLTRDLIGVAGQHGIQITASFVTLDLNGFSLIGGPGTLSGIRASVALTKQVTVRNGVIRDWGGSGLDAAAVSAVKVEDLGASGNGSNGISVGAGSVVTGCNATSNGAAGIIVSGSSTVARSTVASNGTSGMVLISGSMATDCMAQGNVTGFNLSAGSSVSRCVARQNSTGILGTDFVTIEGCTATSNTDDGIRVAGRSVVRGNTTNANTNDGIEASGNENRIEDNQSSSNGSGISIFGTSNLVVKNSVSSNLSFEYLIFGGGNQIGPISTDPTTAGPWANFDL
ncbi:MAG: right-handed parallel beta-helix repeat-containing protein [Candidatus Polarisedimenticolia bacterium]